MKPYPGTHRKGSRQRIYNYRLCRARRIVENAFGILATVFRILRAPIILQPNKASLVTLTCVLLHNFLKNSKTSRRIYFPAGTFDREEEGEIIPGTWRTEMMQITSLLPLQKTGRKATVEAQTVREEFTNFFMTAGKVAWQDLYS